MSAPLLDIRDLRVALPGFGRPVLAVDGLDLCVERGEVHGLVGESGSGKSLSMMAVLGLLPRGARASGSARLDGTELIGQPARVLQKIRGKRIGLVLQDPMTALNPVMTIGAQLVEAIRLHESSLSRALARRRAADILAQVAIAEPERRLDQYPHEFSGGMRQRVVIAMAISNDPDLLIADEPTTALDVTIQAQIVELLDRLRRERNLGLVLITHDLGLVAGLADRLTILYSGRVAERGSVFEVFAKARHPYTRGLMRAMPSADGGQGRLVAIEGSPPSPMNRPAGCAFHPRCPEAIAVCRSVPPPAVRSGGDLAACHRADEPERGRERETADAG